MNSRACEHCGASLESRRRRRDARYCSPACRFAAWESRNGTDTRTSAPEAAQSIPTHSNAFHEPTEGFPWHRLHDIKRRRHPKRDSGSPA